MQVIGREEIKRLAEFEGKPCLTVTMPVYKMGAEIRQNPIRLRNLLRKAEEKLGPEADHLLSGIRTAMDAPDFWAHPEDGFVLFAARGFTRYYHVPFDIDERVMVGERFHLSPLIRMIDGGAKYWVLALSQNQVRLIACTQRGGTEVKLPEGVPENLVDAMKFDDPERKPGMLNANPSGKPHLHGRSTSEGDGKILLQDFLRQIDRGLHEMFREQKAPLVLASVEFLQPIYRAVSTYQHLVEEGVHGNPEGQSADELSEKAWPLVEPLFKRAQRDAAERFGKFSADGRSSKSLEDIIQAAYTGRVDSLFVAAGLLQWGSAQPKVDEAAIETLLHGGAVYAVDPEEIPDNVSIAAVYRY